MNLTFINGPLKTSHTQNDGCQEDLYYHTYVMQHNYINIILCHEFCPRDYKVSGMLINNDPIIHLRNIKQLLKILLLLCRRDSKK